MTPAQARAILARRKASRVFEAPASSTFDLDAFLFKEQLAFVRDEARFATAVCSVRAGKTTACAADLVDTALKNPGTTGLYITLARSSAKRIVWPELLKINRQFRLMAVPNLVDLSLTFPNGSVIYCGGANTEAEIEKYRGLSNVVLIYLDESQAFREYIRELVEDIAIKRLYDTNGRLRAIGTPGPLLTGYFYEIAHSPQWSHHHWTLHHNPHLLRKARKTADELIAQDCARKGVDVSDPSIQRECFGRWVFDPDSLLLAYDASLNDYGALPGGKYTYILGIDLGTRDADSLSVLGWAENSPVTYLIEEILQPNQLTDDLALQIKGLMERYPIAAMPTDAGGLGLKIVEDLKARYGLPLTPADKRDKMANYKHLNNALRTGNFKAKKETRFASDCNLLERDDDKSTPERIVVKGHSDAVDSCLYAFKLSPAYAYRPPEKKPEPGSDAFTREQEELHLKAAIAQVEEQRTLADKKEQYGSWKKDKKGIPDWNKW